MFGLIALKISEAQPTPAGRSAVAGIAALGQRSLSGYLCQSVAWLMTLAPFTLALGARFHSPMLTGIAIALLVWLLTVVAAPFLSRRGQPGPAEAVLRRLTYGAAS